MYREHRIAVVIPALNEEQAIARVLGAVPGWVDEVVVADNGSTDATARVAGEAGARVVYEPRRGYGSACLAGLAALAQSPPDVVVFLDGDASDSPDEMARLVDPIVAEGADMVVGSRALGEREPGALALQSRFGNVLACFLLRLFFGARYTDLMQLKAARAGLRTLEVPVSYRRRVGQSKISGTIRGCMGAGYKILYTIFRYALART